jgi:hypothetical protein
MPEAISSRLPIPHVFMALTIGAFALMTVSAFAPAAANEGVATATGQGSAGPALEPAAPAVDLLAIASLVVLVALLAATIRAGRAGAHGSGRPVLGLVAGLLAGAAGATALFSLGAIALSSPIWAYAPLALGTLGAALGLTVPFHRRVAAPAAVATYPAVSSRSAA